MAPDLELIITLKEDGRTLIFELSSVLPQLGFFRKDVGSTLLTDAPRQYLDRVFRDLSLLAQQQISELSLSQQAQIVNDLTGIGQRLYDKLFPSDLKRAYRKIRLLRRERPLSLLITSDEPWIPWELIKPYDEGEGIQEVIDDPFFCEQFYLTRWIRGIALPQPLDVETLAVVVPTSDLQSAQREHDYFAAVVAQKPQSQMLKAMATYSDVLEQLYHGRVHLWHFACHGNFASDDPDASTVYLEGGELCAEDIVGPARTGVRKSRPLVMLNACHTGRQGFALTGLGGWAWQLIPAGASAFIGSQWEAHDELAADFAIAFYDGLRAGATLGEAVHTARKKVKEQAPTNPTWLTYVVYGLPELQIKLKPQTEPAETSEAAATKLASTVVIQPTEISDITPIHTKSSPPQAARDSVLLGDLPSFTVGKPIIHPRQFFGRGRELKRIFGILKQPYLQNAAIIGPKRSGKTSLLNYLEHIITTPTAQLRPGQRTDWLSTPEQYRWVHLAFQDKRLRSCERVLQHILEQLHIPVPQPCNIDRFMEVMEGHLHAPAVILMDEVGVALERYPELDDAFWESLRSLASSQVGSNLGFVLTAHQQPYELAHSKGLGSPFFNIFGYIATLGPLTEPEARELIASSPISFPNADVEWMLTQSGRWPILLQILCRERLFALENDETGDAWRDDALRQVAPFRHLLEVV